MIPSVIAYCPELGRDISRLQAAVPTAQVYRATRTPQGTDGCLLAHQGIVRLAHAQRWPAVFVMEDDCELTEHFSPARWEADVAWAAAAGYTVLSGGCISAARPRLVRAGLFAVARFKSAHCIVYRAEAYALVLRATPPYLDIMLGRLGARCLLTYPFVAVQRPGFSGILNRYVDYRPKYRRFEQRLGELATSCAL